MQAYRDVGRLQRPGENIVIPGVLQHAGLQNCLGHLFCEQRNAVSFLRDSRDQCSGQQLAAGHVRRYRLHVLSA